MLFLVLETNVWKKENHSKQKTTFPNHPFEKIFFSTQRIMLFLISDLKI